MSLIGANNIVVIQKLSDFPTPVSGIIKLENNIDYYINGSINIGTNQIERGISNLITGRDKSNDIIIFTGSTGSMFIDGATGTNQDISIAFVTLAATVTGGSVFNISGTTYNCEIRDCIFGNCVSLGTITGGNILNFRQNLISGCAQGITFGAGNTTLDLNILDSIFLSNTGTCTAVTINNGTYGNIIIRTIQIIVTATQTGLNVGASVVLTYGGIVTVSNFSGAGNKILGINVETLNWKFSGNYGIANKLVNLFIEPYNISPVAVTVPTVAACVTAIYTSVTGQIVLTYSGTADQNANTSFMMPLDYHSNFKIRFFLAPTTTVAAVNTNWSPIVTIKAIGSTMNTVTETLTPQNIISGTANVSYFTGWFTPGTTIIPESIISLRISRLALNAADTYTGTMILFGVQIYYYAV